MSERKYMYVASVFTQNSTEHYTGNLGGASIEAISDGTRIEAISDMLRRGMILLLVPPFGN